MKSIQDIRLVVCDMIGTTIRDHPKIEHCFSLSAKQTGLKMTDEEILAVQGWAIRQVFETYWERQTGERNNEWLKQVEHSYSVFRKILEDHYKQHEVLPIEGSVELFKFLMEKGIAIALTTGLYRKVADILLGKLGWIRDGLVQVSVTSDEVEKGRPEPHMIRKAMDILGIYDRKTVINIGDTPSDIQSGKKAGVLLSCCVTNGSHSLGQLSSFNPDIAFGSLHDFRSFLQSRA